MNLIITMAGEYSRFKDGGYQIPKFLLPWGNESILSEILKNLNKDNVFENIFLIANKKDEQFMPHVRDIMKSLNIPVVNLFLIEKTNSQAETAYKGIRKINKFNSPVFFHNIDTILYNRDFKELNNIIKKCDGYIDIFKSNNHNYSYVTIKNKIVTDIVEKVVVSNSATSGLYGFNNPKKFLDFYKPEDNFISDVYHKMIEKECIIYTSKLYSEKETLVLGTPMEYNSLIYLLDMKEKK